MSNVDAHKSICEELNALYIKKNSDYGDSFHKTFVDEGMAMARIRLGDKYNRFCALTRKDNTQKVADESIRDTLIDLANYAIMTVMEMPPRAESESSEEKLARAEELQTTVCVKYWCNDCPLSDRNNRYREPCSTFVRKHPDEAVPIMLELLRKEGVAV